MTRLILLFLLMGYYNLAAGQSFLYLKKVGSRHFVSYKTGDEIRFQLKEDTHFSSGLIESFGQGHFVIHETEIKLSDIYRYDIRGLSSNRFNYKVSSTTLFTAGGLLPLAELTNQQVSGSGDDTGIHQSIWKASGVLMAGGLILKWLAPKYFKPDVKRKATIISK